MYREISKRQWFLGDESVTFPPSISTIHIYCFSYIYMCFEKKKKKEERSKETKKDKDRKERKELQATGFNIHYLPRGLLAKLWNQFCFLTISQVILSLNQVTEKIRFALNYHSMYPNLFFKLVYTDLPSQPDCLYRKIVLGKMQLFIQVFWRVCRSGCTLSLAQNEQNN